MADRKVQQQALTKGWKAVQDLRDQSDVRAGKISRLEKFEGRRS